MSCLLVFTQVIYVRFLLRKNHDEEKKENKKRKQANN